MVLVAGSAPVYSVAAHAAPSVQDDMVLLGTQSPKPSHHEDKKPCDGRRKPRPTQSMRQAAAEVKSAGLMHFYCMRCAKAIFLACHCLRSKLPGIWPCLWIEPCIWLDCIAVCCSFLTGHWCNLVTLHKPGICMRHCLCKFMHNTTKLQSSVSSQVP